VGTTVPGCWSAWGAYGQPSKTCGTGATKTRTRKCVSGKCEGPSSQTVAVTVPGCWSAWGAYGSPSKACGTGATKTRTRKCVSGKCEGPSSQTVAVTVPGCWSAWGKFGPYSKSCGNGARHTRTRTCGKPGNCPGSSSQTVTVNLAACPPAKKVTYEPTKYQICGTKKCKSCSSNAGSCSKSGLDRDKDKSDIKNCYSGYIHDYWRKYDQWWPAKDVYLRICKSNPKAVMSYRYQMCDTVNCFRCVKDYCSSEGKKHLQGLQYTGDYNAFNKVLSVCPSGYVNYSFYNTGKVGNYYTYTRTCRSSKTYSN